MRVSIQLSVWKWVLNLWFGTSVERKQVLI